MADNAPSKTGSRFSPVTHRLWVNRTLLTSLVVSGIATVDSIATPALVQSYVSVGGLTDSQAGLLYSVEVAGYALGALLIMTMGLGFLRRFAIFGISAFIVGNVLSGPLRGLMALGALRALVGLGAGILVTVSMVVIGGSSRPDRNFSWWVVLELLLGALGIAVLPELAGRFGMSGFFLPMAIAAAVVSPAVLWYPEGAAHADSAVPVRMDFSRLRAAATCLLGVFVYFAGQYAIYAYVELLAVRNGLSPQTTQNALTVSLVCAVGTALLAAWLLRPARRATVLVAVTLVVAATIIAFGRIHHAVSFYVAVALFNGGSSLTLPALSALTAEVDLTGRLMTWFVIVLAGAASAGPAAGAILVQRAGYGGVLSFGIICVAVGLALAFPAIIYTRKRRPSALRTAT